MQAGTLIDSDSLAYTSRILVNGVQREHESWSVDRELSGDLPAQVAAVSGITQATGSVSWASSKDVDSGGLNPWNSSTGWLPRKGDRVEIYAGDGVTEWKQFHGVIDRTTGTVTEGFQSTLIDDYDRLSAGFSHEAMLRVMPPLAWDGSEPYRSAGLHPLYYVDRALRTAGFYCTPPREYDTALYVPLQGSRSPHYGNLQASTDFLNTSTPWGLGARDGNASWLPASGKTMGAATQVTLMVAPDHTTNADVYLDYGGAANHLRLAVNGSRVAIAQKNGVEVCRVPLGEATLVSMLAKGGTITLRTSLGVEASGAFTASGTTMSLVRLTAGMNSSVAGLQVSHPALSHHDHASTRWTPTAVFDTASLYLAGIIDAAPTIEGVTCGELLDGINNAILAAMWIDEQGVMRWASSDTLRNRSSVRTVTTLNDILSLQWEDGLLATASQVTVKGKKPAVSKSRWRNIVLARGGGGSLKSGDEQTIVLEPGGDEDWITPSFNFLEVGGAGGIWNTYNNPAYSVVGLYYTADGGTTTAAGLTTTITTETLGLQKVSVKYVAGTWPADVEGVIATSPTAETLWPKNRNQDLPRVIGRGKIQWSDQEITPTGAGGPGPALTHDAGYWANRTDSTDMLDRYGSYLQAQTATPSPVITGLEIVPDPRLQLGDVITIDSPSLMGVTLRALIVGIDNGADGSFTQSLSVRIISATTTFTTYAEYDKSLGTASLTYAQWQALGPVPQTYKQFNTAS